MNTEALTTVLLDRVDAGAEFLDANIEWDWRAEIDLSSLDIGSTCLCVLGQLGTSGEFQDVFGFNAMADHLGILGSDTLIELGFDFDELSGEDFERDYGFDPYSESDDDDIQSIGYQILTDLWASKLREPV